MSFPPGTEMFQFPGFALNPYGFRVQSPHGPRSPSPRSPLDSRYGVEGGLPHSEIPGSKLVRSSPRLIAAYHVLHRLSAPRHPPNALKTLDRSHDRCPPLGSDAHRVQKDHFRSQTPERPRAGAPMIGNGACRTRPIRLQAAGAASSLGHVPSSRCQTSADRERGGESTMRTPAPGGARRDRTDDLMLAKHALSQLSYGPILGSPQAPARASARLGPHALGRGGRSALPRPWRAAVRRRGKAQGDARRRRRLRPPNNGGPGTTRTSDLTLIRGAL
jgi:hypothetical protein